MLSNQNVKYMKWAILPAIAMAIIGIYYLLNGVEIGNSLANRFQNNLGISIDATEFRLIKEKYIQTYQWLGAILMTIGLSFFMYILVKLSNVVKR